MIVFLVTVTLAGAVMAADPFVMVHQTVVSQQPIGLSTGFDIDYTLINMADEPAKVLAIKDLDSIDHDQLPESIPGHGGRIQFRAHIAPKYSGHYEPAPLKVDYVYSDQTVQSVYSTNAEPVVVLSNEEYASATEKFIKQYTVFGSVAIVMVAMPALLIVRDYFFYTHGCPNSQLGAYRRTK